MVTKATRDVIDLNVREINDGIRVDGDNSVNFSIDGTTIGGLTPGDGTFVNLEATNLIITGTIDGSGATVIGTWDSTYADIAELYESDKDYAPGTVVKIGGGKEITATENSQDDVFGVISSNPAYVLNSGKEGLYLPVVIIGRSPVRVNGPISKGDRLISSEWSGVARRALDSELSLRTFGRSLEDSDDAGERLVEIAFITIR
jgi:hypothetical protein